MKLKINNQEIDTQEARRRLVEIEEAYRRAGERPDRTPGTLYPRGAGGHRNSRTVWIRREGAALC